MKEQDLYSLVYPEYQELTHGVHFFTGLEAIGASSWEDALRQGFVRVRAKPEELYIPEEELLEFRGLIARVREQRLRAATEETEAEQGENPSARWQELYEALEASQGPLTQEEEQCLRELLPAERDWTQEDFAQRLSAHRQSRAALAQGAFGSETCTCTLCRKRAEDNHNKAAQKRRDDGNRLRESWELVDHETLAQEVLGTEAEEIRPERRLRCYYQAVWEALGLDPAPDGEEALRKAIIDSFVRRLQALREEQQSRDEQAQRVEALEEYLAQELMPAWKQKKAAWEEELRSLHTEAFGTQADASSAREIAWGPLASELQHILTECERRFTRFVRSYEGHTSLAQAQETVQDLLKACEKETRRQRRTLQQHAAFRAAYAEKSDFTSLFAQARTLKRQLYFFCGPTNSGKTHAAFEELARCDSGVYLSPLRLLALEGQAQLSARGRKASFLTGEERNELKGARFISSTIEMLNTRQVVGGAIIDEIQMLAHPQRGWAWTQALVGVPAYKVYMTGSDEVLPIVKKIAAYLQEPLEIRTFTRFNTLQVLSEASGLDALEPATAVICFSRRDVLGLKKEIEQTTSYKVAVIYGALAPEVRRQEAQRFRQGDAEILVATDAIGMGLNLPIRTVLFWTLHKTSQGLTRRLEATEILQIAGRAGRYGLEEQGFVGAFSTEDLATIQEVLSSPLPPFGGPCPVMPTAAHIELLAQVLQTDELSPILHYFQHELWFNGELFFPWLTRSMQTLAAELEEPLQDVPLEEKLTFARAPVPTQSRRLLAALKEYATAYATGEPLTLPPTLLLSFMQPHTDRDDLLYRAEQAVARLTLYRWLAYHFPKRFAHTQEADIYRHILNRYISRSLQQKDLTRRCRSCGTQIPFRSPHRICNTCYHRHYRPA